MLLLAFDTATSAVTAAVHDGARTLAEETSIDARRHGELLLPSVDRALRRAGRDRHELTAIVVGAGPGPYTGLRVGLVTAAALGDALGLPVYGLCTLDGLAHAALRAGLTGEFLVATDARRKEVYWARYDTGRVSGRPDGDTVRTAQDGHGAPAPALAPLLRVEGPAVDRPAELPEEIAVLPCVGAGAGLYREGATNGWGVDALESPEPGEGMPLHQSAAALADLAAGLLRAAPAGAPPGAVATAGAPERTEAGDAEAAALPPGFVPPLPLYLRRPDAKVPAGYKAVLP